MTRCSCEQLVRTIRYNFYHISGRSQDLTLHEYQATNIRERVKGRVESQQNEWIQLSLTWRGRSLAPSTVPAYSRPSTMTRRPGLMSSTRAVQAVWHSVRLDQRGLSPSVLCYATIGKGGGGGGDGQVSTFYLENLNKTIVQLT